MSNDEKIKQLEEENKILKDTLNKFKNQNLIIHSTICPYKNQIELVDKLILIYSIIVMNKNNSLRKFERDVLNYYIRYGFSLETKKKINKELGKSMETITQATFFLAKKGYLIKSKTNLTNKYLNPELQSIRDNIIEGDKKILAVGFKRK